MAKSLSQIGQVGGAREKNVCKEVPRVMQSEVGEEVGGKDVEASVVGGSRRQERMRKPRAKPKTYTFRRTCAGSLGLESERLTRLAGVSYGTQRYYSTGMERDLHLAR